MRRRQLAFLPLAAAAAPALAQPVSVRIDYHDGLRYSAPGCIEGRPDRLAALLAAR